MASPGFERFDPVGDLRRVALGREAEVVELLAPAPAERDSVGAGLAGAAVDRRLPFDGPALPRCRSASDCVDEALDLLVASLLHLLGAFRELGKDLLGSVGHLGQAVLDGLPTDSEPRSQLGAQTGGVQGGDGALVALEGAGVEGQAGVLTERRRDQPVGVDGPDLPVDPVAAVGMILDPPERGSNRGVMGVEDLPADVLVADGEQHRHRLRCRAGDVEAPHGPVGVAGAEQRAVHGVDAIHDGEEVLVVGLAGQAEHLGPSAEPPAGRFVAVEVVAARAVDVVRAGVGALEGGHAGGHGRLPHERVHSSVNRCDGLLRRFEITASLLQREAAGG
jgi:hypothetical protein